MVEGGRDICGLIKTRAGMCNCMETKFLDVMGRIGSELLDEMMIMTIIYAPESSDLVNWENQ